MGVGIVEAPVTKVSDFTVEGEHDSETLLSQLGVEQGGMFTHQDDDEKAEYLVRVRWLHTVAASEAVWETGFFANQNSVCAPTTSSWKFTIDRLRRHFSVNG